MTDCFGTASTAHGSKYVGEWKNSKFYGKGAYTSSNGDTTYVGEFKYGSRHGQGGKLLLLVGAFLAVTVGESLLA
ncbi:MAG TPA: hypothetical protein EYG65_00530 [Rhodospirillales bacterium]|nr:hypothetical protein [Rhodospirillales bacterium]